MANRKGNKSERELVTALDDIGFAVMRAPASGAATKRELPDVLAGNSLRFYAIEAKSSSEKPIYIDEDEIQALIYFAVNFGAEPRIGVRFDSKHGDPTYGTDFLPWYFFSPDQVHRTDGGNYRIKKETALMAGETLDDL